MPRAFEDGYNVRKETQITTKFLSTSYPVVLGSLENLSDKKARLSYLFYFFQQGRIQMSRFLQQSLSTQKLFEAATNGELSTVQKQHLQGGHIDSHSFQGITPLKAAVKSGKAKVYASIHRNTFVSRVAESLSRRSTGRLTLLLVCNHVIHVTFRPNDAGQLNN